MSQQKSSVSVQTLDDKKYAVITVALEEAIFGDVSLFERVVKEVTSRLASSLLEELKGTITPSTLQEKVLEEMSKRVVGFVGMALQGKK